MKYYKLLVLIILVTILTSCSGLSDVRFITPQPEFLEPLASIPKKFQGIFLIEKDTIQVTEHTIDGNTINSDSLIVKSWGNYLFVNQMKKNYYALTCAKSVNVWNNEEINLQYFSVAEDVSRILEKSGINSEKEESEATEFLITNNLLNIIGVDTSGKRDFFIIDELTTNQFQTMLNKSVKNSVKVIRIE